jgi:nanoRNase/pAp phosphatase (c-di-AMP/oligoRNAs hydrolase)
MKEIDILFKTSKRLLIVLHDNPDPDAIASAWALSSLAIEKFNLRTAMTYGGYIGRAENRAMVRELKIPLKMIGRVRFSSYDKIAMVDTQPGAQNNSLPPDVPCHLVIDHHPRRRGLKAETVFIDTEVGATATILIEWLRANQLDFNASLATALAYAIRSETQDLGREASRRDIEAYLTVYPRSSMRKMARITHPKLPRSYFFTLDEALRLTTSFRNIICTHIGEVPYPEVVAEMADLLLKHERISWSLCTGRFMGELIISVRSSNPKAHAGKLIQALVPDRSRAGGHDMFAGGKIPLVGYQKKEIDELEKNLSKKFASLLGHENPEWKPLIDPYPG